MMKLKVVLILFVAIVINCCSNLKDAESPVKINVYADTYEDVHEFSHYKDWGPYNLHDPSIIFADGYYYCYSTDAAYGQRLQRSGIMVRRSKDLLNWEYIGWACDTIPEQTANHLLSLGVKPVNGNWAPYILKYKDIYRLYYSQASNKGHTSAIGLLVGDSPLGPWTESGIVVKSYDEREDMTNAIDPSVVVSPEGEHWMVYGSAWAQIHLLQLNPETGLSMEPESKGERIAARGSTGGIVNGNIEGPEIIYNEELKKYYLFIAYDWLSTKYNVRVGRSESPSGPFYDFNNNNMNKEEDNIPMIIAPYAFKGHQGWQGLAHCSVFKHDGNYYMANQGRPAEEPGFMVMHARKIFWTKDGWPVVSPQRFANVEQKKIIKEDIIGEWERIIFNDYKVVPGYAREQTDPDIKKSLPFMIRENGSVNDDPSSSWEFRNNTLTINWSDGMTDELIVSRGYDWENKKECLVFTGLNNEGTAIWGKK